MARPDPVFPDSPHEGLSVVAEGTPAPPERATFAIVPRAQR
jgi:hypothetical protein